MKNIETKNLEKYGVDKMTKSKKARKLTRAFKIYKKAAKQGCSEAQHMLGYMYYSGLGIKKNKKKAYQWFKKSAR